MADDTDPIRRICHEDPRFHAGAYHFVQAAVAFTQEQLAAQGHQGHISGPQLLEGIRQMALRDYGPLTRAVLADWGVTTTHDFGCIVFNMVRHQLLGARKSDKLTDFDDVYDFADAFEAPFRPEGRRLDLPVIDSPAP